MLRGHAGCIAIVAVGLLNVSMVAEAQRTAISHRIGWLGSSSAPSTPDPVIGDFQQGLRDLGYVEGKNLVIEYRYANGNVERLAALANEVASMSVEVIVTSGEPAALAAKRSTKTVPIVVTELGLDPVKAGLVASLGARRATLRGWRASARSYGRRGWRYLRSSLPKPLTWSSFGIRRILGNTSCLKMSRRPLQR